ncbi:MAG TPA: AsmA family protein [Bryobacteraceae bacterium]
MKWRRILIGIIIAIVAIIIALVIAVSLVNVNRFRPQIQAELEAKLNRPVSLGRMHLHIFPLSIKVDGITIGEPKGFPATPPFVQAKEVSASAGFFSILEGNPVIHNLTLTAPHVELIQNREGVWNFSNIGPPAQKPGPPAKQPSKPTAFTLKELKIADGQIAVTNERTKSPRSVYSHIDVTLTNFAPGQPFTIDADAHFPGPGKESLSFQGTGGPLATDPSQVTPLNGQLSLQQIALSNLNSFAPGAVQVGTKTTVSGKITLATNNGKLTGKGDLTVADSTVNFTANVNPVATPITANLQAQTKNASLSNLLELANAFGAAAMQNTLDGNLTAQTDLNFALDPGASLASTLNGTLNFQVTNGHFKKANLVSEIARGLKGTSSQSGNSTILKRLGGTFQIRRGIASTNNLAGTFDVGSLSAKGSLNLVNETLDMHMTAALLPGVSKITGGFLKTALANKNGELTIPLHVTGSMEHPVFTPDLGSLLKKNTSKGLLNSLFNAFGKKH